MGAFEIPLRFPGQYADRETGLVQNWFRDYDPALGRYGRGDPIGLAGGMNLYRYADNDPLTNSDPFGLDVTVCFYSKGVTHIGYGVGGERDTMGFYPRKFLPMYPGEIRGDPKASDEPRACKKISTTAEQDVCMLSCRLKWQQQPGWYSGPKRQCTTFVRECMRECNIPTGIEPQFDSWQGPWPSNFFKSLPGIPIKE